MSKHALLALAALGMLGVLSACVSGKPQQDTFVGANGKTTTIESDSEHCAKSCNAEYARCMDTYAAQNGSVNGPSEMFGANAGCRSALSSCTLECKGR